MSSPREIELKLELPAASVRRLTANPLLKRRSTASGKPADVVSVYYDTDRMALHRRGLTLRLRQVGDRHVQTVKQEGPARSTVMDRGEWESDVPTASLDYEAARATALKPLLDKKFWRGLRPIFETRVRRHVFKVARGSSEIELDIDEGEVASDKKSARLCEVELELKRGEPKDLFGLARSLAKIVPLQLAVRSKSERGYALIDSVPPQAVKATPVALTPKMDTASAFQMIARACVYQIAANRPAVIERDPEGIHQMRVALRRLRAAMAFFAAMLSGEQVTTLKSGLKWLTAELGPARDLDVFLARVVQPQLGRGLNGGMRGIAEIIAARRDDAVARARAAVESPRFRALVLDLAAWIEAGDWLQQTASVRDFRDRPIARTASAEFARRHRKILKRGAKLAELDPGQRHRLRIAAKKLRYAAEFCAAAFPGKKQRRRQRIFVKSLGKLQNALGDLNDIAVHADLTRGLAVGDGRGPASAHAKSAADSRGTRVSLPIKAFAAGRLSGREEARVAPVLAQAEDAYASFGGVKPFWR